MPLFNYKAVSPDGDVIEGELEASSRQAVVDRLHAQGHVPIKAEPRRRSMASPSSLSALMQPRAGVR